MKEQLLFNETNVDYPKGFGSTEEIIIEKDQMTISVEGSAYTYLYDVGKKQGARSSVNARLITEQYGTFEGNICLCNVKFNISNHTAKCKIESVKIIP